jgi:hypothetical protein
VLCLAVASPHCRRALPPDPLPSGATLLARVRTDRERLGTLVATFSAHVSRRRGLLGSTTLTGALAMEPPDRFRVRLVLPGGLTVHDLTVVGDRYRLDLPLEARTERGILCFDPAPHCPGDPGPGLMLAWLFTHDPARGAGASTVTGRREQFVVSIPVTADGRLRRAVVIARDDFRLLAEEAYRGEDRWVRVDYGAHRLVAGIPVPHSVELTDERGGTRITLEIAKYRPHATLPGDAFRLE